MSSQRLRSQFESLFEHCQGRDTDIQLEDITDLLFCTRRNARIVLNKMEEEGWIEWHPAAGRGRLSQLIFKQSRNEISENLARRYLEDGKFDQALTVLENDATKLTQVIQNYLGVQQQEGQQVVRLPYYRPLSRLSPRINMRRSEQHIVKQVFSGLTKLDEKDRVGPDIAHFWEQLTPTQWRFYLRPGIRFHNGEPLTIEQVIDSVSSLKQFPLFSHIHQVEKISDWVIDICLSKADYYLDLWLTESCAKIVLAPDNRPEDYELLPVGTGPYRIVQNDEKRLVLAAFDGYFGFRPLIDRVEVCVIDDANSSLAIPSLTKPIITKRGSVQEDVGLDPGCLHLLLNRKTGLAKESTWADYFVSKFNSLSIFRAFPQQTIVDLGIVPALGLKPGWYHSSTNKEDVESIPELNRPIRIAYHAKNPMFPQVINHIQTVLKADGYSVELITYEYELDDVENIDIWIKAMGISNYRDDAIAGWLLNYSDIQPLSKPEHFELWRTMINDWRGQTTLPFPAMDLGKSLVLNKQIIPLFHVWLGINHDQCGSLQNAKCNALGWFDFSHVWVKPEI